MESDGSGVLFSLLSFNSELLGLSSFSVLVMNTAPTGEIDELYLFKINSPFECKLILPNVLFGEVSLLLCCSLIGILILPFRKFSLDYKSDLFCFFFIFLS